ncbi:transporter substrate-binding domain-containing protein, partial [bacterium]|nr:transporter substrate-binding domain-containing protein [bacterium]
KVDTWSTIKQELAGDKLDVLPLVGRTPERESIFDFTVPYLTLHGTIVVRKGNNKIQNAADLKGKKVGVMKGDVAEEYMLREKLSDKLVTTNNFDTALQQLNSGKLDAVVVQTLVGLQLINKLGLGDLETRGKLDSFRQDWSFAVTEGDKELLAELNEGLSIVIANGTYDQLRQKWLGILEPDHTKEYIYTIIITAVTVMFVAFLIARLWQRSLRNQVKKSTKELQNYKNDLEVLVTTRTKELATEQFKLNQAQKIAHIGNYRWDTKEDKTTWSDELFRITGYEPQAFEPTYEKYIDCLHPEDRDRFSSLTQQVLKNKTSYSAEYRLVRPDGKVRYVLEKGEVKFDGNNLSALVGVIQDITERYKSEESLRISQQRLLLHRDQSPVGVIEWNTDFEFLDWNPAAEKIFGYTKNEVTGIHITERILPESARPAVDKVWADLLAKKGGFYSLNENTTKDGRTILCEWHNTPLIDHNGKVIGVTSLVDDVTERQRSEEDLRQSYKMDAIGKLTGGVAHDFNNMLGVILGFSELIKVRVGDCDPKISKYSDEITNAGERAKKLTSKLLEFSRKTPSSTEVILINELIRGMQHMLEKTLT